MMESSSNASRTGVRLTLNISAAPISVSLSPPTKRPLIKPWITPLITEVFPASEHSLADGVCRICRNLKRLEDSFNPRGKASFPNVRARPRVAEVNLRVVCLPEALKSVRAGWISIRRHPGDLAAG